MCLFLPDEILRWCHFRTWIDNRSIILVFFNLTFLLIFFSILKLPYLWNNEVVSWMSVRPNFGFHLAKSVIVNPLIFQQHPNFIYTRERTRNILGYILCLPYLQWGLATCFFYEEYSTWEPKKFWDALRKYQITSLGLLVFQVKQVILLEVKWSYDNLPKIKGEKVTL